MYVLWFVYDWWVNFVIGYLKLDTCTSTLNLKNIFKYRYILWWLIHNHNVYKKWIIKMQLHATYRRYNIQSINWKSTFAYLASHPTFAGDPLSASRLVPDSFWPCQRTSLRPSWPSAVPSQSWPWPRLVQDHQDWRSVAWSRMRARRESGGETTKRAPSLGPTCIYRYRLN